MNVCPQVAHMGVAESSLLPLGPEARHAELQRRAMMGADALGAALAALGRQEAAAALAHVGGAGGRSLWHAAVASGDPGCIARLRDVGRAAIDARDGMGRTPLHQALGWTAKLRRHLLPALQHACLRDAVVARQQLFAGPSMALGTVVERLRLYYDQQVQRLAPQASASLGARSDRQGTDALVRALLVAGADPTLLVSVPTPALEAHGPQAEALMLERINPATRMEAGSMLRALPEGQHGAMDAFSALRMAICISASNCIMPLVDACVARGWEPARDYDVLLATDAALRSMAQAHAGDGRAAAAAERTHRKLVMALWNRLKNSPEHSNALLTRLAESHDDTMLDCVLSAVESQSARDARRNIDQATPSGARFLTALLASGANASLVRRTLAIGASPTNAVSLRGLGMVLRPLHIALGLTSEKTVVAIQVVLDPVYRRWMAGILAHGWEGPGVETETETEIDIGLMSASVRQLRDRPLPTESIAALLEAGASATDVLDLSIVDHVRNYPAYPPEYPAEMSRPLAVSPCDVCALSDDPAALEVVLKHPSMRGQTELLHTAAKRAALAGNRVPELRIRAAAR